MEIYLSFCEPDLQAALHLKEDLEAAYTGLFVALENEHSWEDVEDFDFDEDRIHQAQILLNLESENSCITSWLIDENKSYCSGRSKSGPPTNISVAPSICINTANSYAAGLDTLIGLTAENMDRNFPLHVSEEEYDINVDYDEDKPKSFSGQASKSSHSERTVNQATQRPPLGSSLFANPKKPALGRTEALKARRKSRNNRKSLLREARARQLYQ